MLVSSTATFWSSALVVQMHFIAIFSQLFPAWGPGTVCLLPVGLFLLQPRYASCCSYSCNAILVGNFRLAMPGMFVP